MIKKIILLFSIISFSNSFSQVSINGKITYNVSSALTQKVIAKKQGSNTDKKTISKIHNLLKNAKNVKAFLWFNNNESLFKLENKMSNEYDGDINFTRIQAGKNRVYYFNNSTKESIEQEYNLLGEYFIIKNQIVKWELKNESKKIGKYLCFKATTTINYNNKKRIIVAWYSNNIPVNFGPKNYNNLPGLIIELNDNNVIFKAIKIELNSKNPILVKKPTKGKRVTREEYNKLLREYFPDFFKKQKKSRQ